MRWSCWNFPTCSQIISGCYAASRLLPILELPRPFLSIWLPFWVRGGKRCCTCSLPETILPPTQSICSGTVTFVHMGGAAPTDISNHAAKLHTCGRARLTWLRGFRSCLLLHQPVLACSCTMLREDEASRRTKLGS